MQATEKDLVICFLARYQSHMKILSIAIAFFLITFLQNITNCFAQVQKTIPSKALYLEIKTADGLPARGIQLHYKLFLCGVTLQPQLRFPYDQKGQVKSCTLGFILKDQVAEATPEGILAIPQQTLALPNLSQPSNQIPSQARYYSEESWYLSEKKRIVNFSAKKIADLLLPNNESGEITLRCTLSVTAEEWDKILERNPSESVPELPVARIESCNAIALSQSEN